MTKLDLEFIANKLKLPTRLAAAIAGVSTKAYQRWNPSAKLSSLIAESVFKLGEVYNTGMMVFDNDEESFLLWMRTPVAALGGSRPTDLLTDLSGIQLVVEQLVRMEFGII